MDEIALFSDARVQLTARKTYDPTLPADMTFSITAPVWPVKVSYCGRWENDGTIPALFDLNEPAVFTEPSEYTLRITPPSA